LRLLYSYAVLATRTVWVAPALGRPRTSCTSAIAHRFSSGRQATADPERPLLPR
jgi:hypothetical protein